MFASLIPRLSQDNGFAAFLVSPRHLDAALALRRSLPCAQVTTETMLPRYGSCSRASDRNGAPRKGSFMASGCGVSQNLVIENKG